LLVSLTSQYLAMANRKTRQVSVLDHLPGQRDQRGHAKARLEDFERAALVAAYQLVDNCLTPFLTVWDAGRGGVFGNPVG
jgi:hypothetical protein